MADLDKYISKLLYDYDCVIIPQFGGFVTNYKPAHLDENQGLLLPPKKDLGFNRNLTRSDGLLEQELANSNKISVKEASQAIKSEVETYWEKLHSGEKIKFQKIGILFFDEELRLQFEPFKENNYLKASFGLDTLVLPTPIVEEANNIEEPAKVIQLEPEPPVITDSSVPARSRSIYWVAAAAILPFVAMSIYFGVKTDFKSPTDTSFAELVPSLNWKSVPSAYKERVSSDDYSENKESSTFPSEGVFQYSFIESKIDSTGVWVDLNKKEAPPVIPTGPYHVIAGCFSQKANAEKMVSRLKRKGYEASILDYHKKLYRVKAESYSNKTSALDGLRDVRAQRGQESFWLLKKRTN